MLKYVRFAELPVSNQDRALRFYTETLGLRVAQDSPYQEDWRWISLEIPGAQTKILFSRRSDEAESNAPSLLIDVDDVHESYEELKSKGVTFTQTPTTSPWGSGEEYALFRDSEGNTIMLGSE
jgi:lactoylglutathione lyase